MRHWLLACAALIASCSDDSARGRPRNEADASPYIDGFAGRGGDVGSGGSAGGGDTGGGDVGVGGGNVGDLGVDDDVAVGGGNSGEDSGEDDVGVGDGDIADIGVDIGVDIGGAAGGMGCEPEVEVCGDGLDNDCDGERDEGCLDDGCTGVDLDSVVRAAPGCITLGTNVVPGIFVDLVDDEGAPLDGHAIEFVPPGPSPALAYARGRYFVEVATPALPGRVAVAVSVLCQEGRMDLLTTARIDFAAPLANDASMSTGGCPSLDGSLRARVVDATTGDPIEGAWVLLGEGPNQALATSAEEAARGDPPAAVNYGQTDDTGVASFWDYGDFVDGPLMVTVGAPAYESISIAGLDAGAVNVPLRRVFPQQPARVDISGEVNGHDSLADDGEIDAGLVVGGFDLTLLASFAIDDILGRFECFDPITTGLGEGFVDEILVPGNLHVPAQLESFLGLPLGIDEHRYSLVNHPVGVDRFVAISGKAPTVDVFNIAAGGGDLQRLLAILDMQEIGVVGEQNVDTGRDDVDIGLTSELRRNVTCVVSNAPADADALCITAGVWSGGNGTGRLFPMGLGSVDAGSLGGAPVVLGLSTVDAAGPFAGIGYIGAAVALFSDAANAPAGLERAASAILDRVSIDGGGGQVNADSFFDHTPLSRVGRTIDWEQVGTENSPRVDACRVDVVRSVSETYDPGACGGNRSDSYEVPVWSAFTRGDPATVSLPALPEGWPRFEDGGFVDTADTPEDDRLRVRLSCRALGLAPDFDYDAANFAVFLEGMTHTSANSINF